jgi:hypothetical protein
MIVGQLFECYHRSADGVDRYKIGDIWIYLGPKHIRENLWHWTFYSINASSYEEWGFLEDDSSYWVGLFKGHFREIE